MKIPKDRAMLIDIQYVKEDRKNKIPDCLYIIWKDLETDEKHLETIPNPPVHIYFEKPEFRNHTYLKTEESKDKLYRKTVKYKDIIYEVAHEDGPEAMNYLNMCFQTRNYGAIDRIKLSPYAFGHDYDIRVLYRNLWMNTYENNAPKHLHKAFGDIEVDTLETDKSVVEFTKTAECPIDLVTIIDGKTKTTYTFCLTGVKCKEKDTTTMSSKEVDAELERREMYKHRQKEQDYYRTHIDELIAEAHKQFDESYPGFEFKAYFYDDERVMLVHLFQLIHKIKADFLMFWNIAFDIPYIINRMRRLGLDPNEIIPHPDFINKICHFKKDNFHFAVKNKTDFFTVSDYTIYIDQMVQYAAIRKGSSELRRTSLQYIAEKELQDKKYDYSEEGNIKTLSYRNWLWYFLYNIKDVLLQYGIEEVTTDLDTLYVYSYENITPYESTFKQTVKLRNVQYRYWEEQNLVPGVNANAILNKNQSEPEEDDEDGDDIFENTGKKKSTGYEGALVGNPRLINHFGVQMYGKPTNNVFRYSIDMDMSAFYPNTIGAMNIYPPNLIFKMILDASQYDVRGGRIPFNGITDVQAVKENDDSFVGDVAKECIDNFATGNLATFAHKWMNFPSIANIFKTIRNEV